MNHKVFGNRLSRPQKQREALYKSLLNALFSYGKIETSNAKAKAVRAEAEKLITKAKKQDVNGRRMLEEFLNKDVADILFAQVKEKFSSRTSGYTRITKLGERFSDTSEMVKLELVDITTEVKNQNSKIKSPTQKSKLEKETL